jgi:hypothetical protein
MVITSQSTVLLGIGVLLFTDVDRLNHSYVHNPFSTGRIEEYQSLLGVLYTKYAVYVIEQTVRKCDAT